MGLRVNTNVTSINAQRNLSAVTDRLGGTRISNVSFAAMIASTLADPSKAANFARIVFDLLVQGQAGNR